MRKISSLAAAGAVVAAMSFAPAAHAQSTDVETLCDSLLGSGTISLGVADASLCKSAQSPGCGVNDTLDLVVVRLKSGLCIDLNELTTKRTVTVRGVVKVKLFP